MRIRLSQFNIMHVGIMCVFLAVNFALSNVHAAADIARDDERARILFEQMAAAMRSAKSLEAQLEITYTRTDKLSGPRIEHRKGVMRLSKPNFAFAETKGGMYQLLASDGKSRWGIFGDGTDYVKKDASSDGRNLSFHMAFLVNYFFTQETDIYAIKKQTGKEMTARYVGSGNVDGTPTEIVELSGMIPDLKEPVTMTFHIGPDHVLRRSMERIDGERVNLLYDATYHDIHIDRDLSPESFAYSPPKGSKPFSTEERVYKLLAVGKTAPGFYLPTPTESSVSLTGALKNSRAVLINFWFYG